MTTRLSNYNWETNEEDAPIVEFVINMKQLIKKKVSWMTCCLVNIFGPPQFMIGEANDVEMWNDADKKNFHNKAVQTNSNLYINNTCNETF